MLIRDTISNFIGGVSQQTDKLMYPNQSKELINFLADSIEGLKRRPPTQSKVKYCEKQPYHSYIHTIIKEDEEYQVLLTGEGLKVFDLEGSEQTVYIIDNAKDYITTSQPLKDLYATTIADYTFILNKTKETSLLPDTYPDLYKGCALIFVKQGDYGIKYGITINNTIEINYTTDKTEVSKIATDYIANQLQTELTNKLATSEWEITRTGSVILLKNNSGEDFTINCTDGNGDNNLFVFYKESSALTDLPVIAPNGFILKIIGDESSNADDYYVKFKTADDSEISNGAWIECCKPDIQYKLNPETMPHALVREKDGTFTFKTLEWTERKAGDKDTCATPSFVGHTIQEVFTYKGRLGFISGDRSCYSDVSDIFSFFKKSALTELDTDPIDVSSNSKMVLLKHSLPFNEGLLLFSETSQFTLKGGDIFSNSTVSLDLATEYQCSKNCKPVIIGSNGYFVFENGNFTRLMTTYITQSYTMNAKDITEQIPSYLPSNVYKITGSTANNILLVLSMAEPGSIYVYNFYHSGDETVQSSWHKWQFEDCKILNVDFNKHLIYLTMEYEDGIYLEVMNLAPKLTENDLDYLIYLDRKIYLNNCKYDEKTDITKVTLPYEIKEDEKYILLTSKTFPKTYTREGKQLLINGKHDNLIFGKLYKSFWKWGKIYLRQGTQNGSLKAVEGTLMLRDINLTYSDSGYFKVNIIPEYTTQIGSSFIFTGKISGQPSATIGKVPIETGTFLIPVISRNEDTEISIESESYLPCCFLSLEWLGEFSQRGK